MLGSAPLVIGTPGVRPALHVPLFVNALPHLHIRQRSPASGVVRQALPEGGPRKLSQAAREYAAGQYTSSEQGAP